MDIRIHIEIHFVTLHTPPIPVMKRVRDAKSIDS